MSVDLFLPVSDRWPALEGFACRHCGALARRHPGTVWVWGCLACGVTTAAVSVFFGPVRTDRGSGSGAGSSVDEGDARPTTPGAT
ncbi:MAG TPA: hypothetical protein VNL16_17790 [Chloroflexota bacterium]|nr:hypothetical protein [Chloroflexota bacterium]